MKGNDYIEINTFEIGADMNYCSYVKSIIFACIEIELLRKYNVFLRYNQSPRTIFKGIT